MGEALPLHALRAAATGPPRAAAPPAQREMRAAEGAPLTEEESEEVAESAAAEEAAVEEVAAEKARMGVEAALQADDVVAAGAGAGAAEAAAAAPVAAEVAAESEAVEATAVEAETGGGAAVKLRGEALVRRSGLTYFILRPTRLDDRPGGSRRLQLSQDDAPESAGASVSRADVAEVVVRSLLDPRACNLACTLSDSAYAGEIAGQEDVSKLLEPLRPNYL